MSEVLVSSAHGGRFIPVLSTKTTRPSSLLYQSSSTTLDDPGFYDNNTTPANKYTWVDRILEIFCGKIRQENKLFTSWKTGQQWSKHDDGASPWLVPVHVISNRWDKDKHRVPVEAKCTIDTGNMQGNIVSRKFVEDVLAYPRESFGAMTKEEEVGAIGITGHRLIPDAAIYLTWYHKKSSRVFRDMRFLISPIEDFDLIIGAVSIQRDRLLDVPNLINGVVIIRNDPTTESINGVLDDVIGSLTKAINKCKDDKAEPKYKTFIRQLNNLMDDLKAKKERFLSDLNGMTELCNSIEKRKDLILAGNPSKEDLDLDCKNSQDKGDLDRPTPEDKRGPAPPYSPMQPDSSTSKINAETSFLGSGEKSAPNATSKPT